MLSKPEITVRQPQSYVAIRETVRLPFDDVVEGIFTELFKWLERSGARPVGPPFIKYNVIDMDNDLEVEFGIPVEEGSARPDGRVVSGILAGGRFGSLVWTGPYDGLYDANAALIGWARDGGIEWDMEETPRGDSFACRLENYLTDPQEVADPQLWETEVAIKLAGD